MDFLHYLNTHTCLLDGAMGTSLLRAGLRPDELPERLNVTQPDLVEHVHAQYAAAGSDVLYTNTFGANAYKLRDSGLDVRDVVQRGIAIARKAAGNTCYVALDVGPLGELVAPLGKLTFDEAYEAFAEVMRASEGADLIAIETMADLAEIKAAVLAAKEHTSLPVIATMTFEEDGRTFTGVPVEAAALVLEGLGVDALGINCSLAPDKIYPIMARLAAVTTTPLVVKANAGLPLPDGSYSVTAKDFAHAYRDFVTLGVHCFGGCCGTTPSYIRELCEMLPDAPPAPRTGRSVGAVCSYGKVVTFDGVRIIGERINPTGKPDVQQALLSGDYSVLLSQAVEQVQAGADILDVNVGLPLIDEKQSMRNVLAAIQAVTDAPLQIDSSNPDVIEHALRYYIGVPIVNSTDGTPQKLERILPLVKKYGACVIGLTLDEHGVPENARERIAIAERICNEATRYGIARRNVLVDCLVLTVSAEQEQVAHTLDAMEHCARKLGLCTVLGISNVSYGLPSRDLVNAAFLQAALARGLNLAIMNPNSPAMTSAVHAWRALCGEDRECADFVARYNDLLPKTQLTQNYPALTNAIVDGLSHEVETLTSALVDKQGASAVIEHHLVPALDVVGELYESKRIFLPQLLRAAEAAQRGFAIVQKALSAQGTSAQRGKVVLATVHGDVHDIGKNIVSTLLSNYGYEVLDLGKNVACEDIVTVAMQSGTKLVGLSALMTSTVPSLAQTIKSLRGANFEGKIMVGGAVLTQEYALSIGADFYAPDANSAVRIASLVYQK